MRLLTLLPFLLLIVFNSNAQVTKKQCACCTAEFKQFDYWIGNWEVFDTLGNKVGENIIKPDQDSCMIRENWTSNTQTGTSTNYYNPADSTWNQLWIDNIGTILVLKGKYMNNQMVLRSENKLSKKGKYYFNQITWDKNLNGTVTQTWDVLLEDGSLIQRVFKGTYKRKLLPKKPKGEK